MIEPETLKDLNLNVNEYSDAEYIVKQAGIKWLKNKYHPDKTTIEIKDWLDFFNITDEELMGETKKVKEEPDMRRSFQ